MRQSGPSTPKLIRRSTFERTKVRAREKEYRKAFDFIDRDKSGHLDAEELHSLFQLVGHVVSRFEVESLIKSVDRNGDQTVDFDEFVALLEKNESARNDEELRRYFRVFDSENKGYISAERLKRCLDQMGEPVTLAEAEAMIKFADLDGDGQVNMRDFVSSFLSE